MCVIFYMHQTGMCVLASAQLASVKLHTSNGEESEPQHVLLAFAMGFFVKLS